MLEDHEIFGAIGFYYSDFRQVSDQDVIDTIARFSVRTPGQTNKINPRLKAKQQSIRK